MTIPTKCGWAVLMLVAAGASPAFGQDISWMQPYSGNIVYGPLSPSPGELPYCPECQCEICQPTGAKGFLKRLFGGACERIERCRREYYFCRQLYHTSYTPPVLPPYCEIGYGYYETHWRAPGMATVVCDPLGQPVYPGVDLEAPEPEIIPPAPADESSSSPPMTQPDPEQKPDATTPPPNQERGDEKPPYEEPVENPGTARWQGYPLFPQQATQMPLITPR